MIACHLARVVILVIAVACVEARQISKSFHVEKNIELVDSFCFDEAEGKEFPSFEISFDADSKSSVLVFDTDGWNAISDTLSTLTCADKLKKSKYQITNSSSPFAQNLSPLNVNYWFIAIGCCEPECSAPVDVAITVNLLNPGSSFPSRPFTKQFSAEESGFPIILGTFTTLFAIIGSVHLYGRLIHRTSAALTHQISHLVSISLLVIFFSVMVKFLHFNIYGATGMGFPAMYSVGDIAEVIFEALTILLSLTISTGWAFGEYSGSSKSSYLVAVGTSLLYLAAYIGNYVAIITYRTPSQPQRYLFDHPCGIFLNLMRLGLAIALAILAKKRMRTHLEFKRRAYGVSLMSIVIWLLFLAAMCALGHTVDFVEQPRYLLLVQLIANFLVVQMFVWLAWPSVATNILSMHQPQLDEGFRSGRVEDDL